MENLYRKPKIWQIILFCFLAGSSHSELYSQEQIIWDNVPVNTTGITAAYSGGTLNVMATGSGLNMVFYSIPTNPTVFQTTGAWNNAPSKDLTFTFPEKVVITRFRVYDINYGTWNDSFSFSNITFSGVTASIGCCATTSGVTVTDGIPPNTDVHWLCSNPIDSFTINYANTNGTTHAYLFYTMEILRLPSIEKLCYNSIPPTLPATLGNNIQGSWSPATINTSVTGTTQYVFTPNSGQAIQCPVSIDVVVLPPGQPNCCIPDLTLTSPGDDVASGNQDNRETSNTITAHNTINSGAVGIYHAKNAITLKKGFYSANGSRFRGYIEGCSGTFVGRQPAPTETKDFQKLITDTKVPQKLLLYPNPATQKATIEYDQPIRNILVTSIDGKTILSKELDANSYDIDLSNYKNGMYIVTVQTGDGRTITSKLVKK
ncbi:hypothetical protein ABH942_001496 [Flavobacterium sp. 28YEA47A]|uniref:T9SS type A sorting domain-containing protein n=1 Tax=Flavobacterium sp. 28YEA47A TaxID=3156276 RepID=UPI0035114929